MSRSAALFTKKSIALVVAIVAAALICLGGGIRYIVMSWLRVAG